MEFDIQKLTTKEETEEDDEEDEDDDEVGSHQKMITFETFFIKNERFNSHSNTHQSRENMQTIWKKKTNKMSRN